MRCSLTTRRISGTAGVSTRTFGDDRGRRGGRPARCRRRCGFDTVSSRNVKGPRQSIARGFSGAGARRADLQGDLRGVGGCCRGGKRDEGHLCERTGRLRMVGSFGATLRFAARRSSDGCVRVGPARGVDVSARGAWGGLGCGPRSSLNSGTLQVDLRRVEVRRAGAVVPLEPKSFDVCGTSWRTVTGWSRRKSSSRSSGGTPSSRRTCSRGPSLSCERGSATTRSRRGTSRR